MNPRDLTAEGYASANSFGLIIQPIYEALPREKGSGSRDYTEVTMHVVTLQS